MPRIFHEMQGPMWMHTPRGEARVVGFFDYGPEDDLYSQRIAGTGYCGKAGKP